MIEFYNEGNSKTVIKEAKEFSKYLAFNSTNALPHPFVQASTTKTTRKAFLMYYTDLHKKLENDYAAAIVIGEMRGTERIMRYLEETSVFKEHPQRDLFYGDLVMLLGDLTKKIRSEFNFECNVNDEFIIDRTEKYAKMEHIGETTI